MSRADRRAARGAASLLVLALCVPASIAAIGAADLGAVVASGHRADFEAEAAAHAAAGELATDPARDALSIAVQAGRTDCSDEGAGDGGGDAALACRRAWAAARSVASTGGGTVVQSLTVGADLRDLRPDPGAGRLVVLAVVALARHLPLTRCGPVPSRGGPLCWARAAGAAQEAA